MEEEKKVISDEKGRAVHKIINDFLPISAQGLKGEIEGLRIKGLRDCYRASYFSICLIFSFTHERTSWALSMPERLDSLSIILTSLGSSRNWISFLGGRMNFRVPSCHPSKSSGSFFPQNFSNSSSFIGGISDTFLDGFIV